ncbi:MAG: LTA synthase family protein [Eubacteriales bacterium]|nr:LTA synthase family protein [Eubacteriales bacterium]
MKHKKKWKIAAGILICLLFAISTLLFISAIWLFRTWGSLTLDEIIYHLSTSIEGTNPDMIWHYITRYGVLVAAGNLMMLAGLAVLYKKKRGWLRYGFIALLLASLVMLGLTGWYGNKKLGIVRYLRETLAQSGEDYIADRYVATEDVQLEFPEKKRNLIYIFLESTEITYADRESGGDFEENIIPELTKLAMEGDCFNGGGTRLNGGYVLPGANWTMGALFAQSSGMPLKIPLNGNRMNYLDEFFPGLRTLGDVLKDEGYQQTFLLGSKKEFGGRDRYYEQHGDFNIKDYTWAVDEGKIPPDYYEFWGFEDEKLFDYAKEELTRLAAEDAPFNLTMLTVDTHFEDGYLCELCGDTYGDNQYANVFACASSQVGRFVEWIKAQDFYENTTIILSGDHNTMDTDFCDGVEEDYVRKPFLAILNSAVEDTSGKERVFSTMDLYPTTLASLGVTIPGGYLGLGTNLYDPTVQTLLEKEGVESVTEGLEKNSAMMKKMSGLVITGEILQKIKKVSYVEAKENAKGMLEFRVKKLHKVLDISSVDKVELRVSIPDKTTGKVKKQTYVMEVEETGTNAFKVTYETDIPYAEVDVENITGRAYVWGAGFSECETGGVRGVSSEE